MPATALTPTQVQAQKKLVDEQVEALRALTYARSSLQQLQKKMPAKPLDHALNATLIWGTYPHREELSVPYEIARKLLLTDAQGRLQRALSRCHLLGIAP